MTESHQTPRGPEKIRLCSERMGENVEESKRNQENPGKSKRILDNLKESRRIRENPKNLKESGEIRKKCREYVRDRQISRGSDKIQKNPKDSEKI
ncbi:hypothetical protein Zmor_025404 [Zophobas morio]|uniref:Uncharacterized protein n=1 Tax=Zophobas morio TaxID=2755281 RepID=A0AA38HT97_9CUCU|nr:hypothetical protein Zmor_025404 [Zophobas morio]